MIVRFRGGNGSARPHAGRRAACLPAALVSLWLAAPGAAAADAIAGRATVIDGDTLEIAGYRIGLLGIDAPDGAQICTTGGRQWLCGQRAALALDRWIADAVVSCDPRRGDRYGRILALCRVRGEELNAWMVAQGWALAYQVQSAAYVSQERIAASEGRGLWQGRFSRPWRWRQQAVRGQTPKREPSPQPQKIGPPIRLTPP